MRITYWLFALGLLALAVASLLRLDRLIARICAVRAYGLAWWHGQRGETLAALDCQHIGDLYWRGDWAEANRRFEGMR